MKFNKTHFLIFSCKIFEINNHINIEATINAIRKIKGISGIWTIKKTSLKTVMQSKNIPSKTENIAIFRLSNGIHTLNNVKKPIKVIKYVVIVPKTFSGSGNIAL